jgi:ribosomal protein S18 acetylase RimI-like enzyme
VDPNVSPVLSAQGASAVVSRKVRTAEVVPALQLILGSHGKVGEVDHAMELMKVTAQRGIQLADIWVAESRGRIRWAALPVVSPGRTVLFFTTSATLVAGEDTVAMAVGIEAISNHYGQQNIQLAQLLIDPADTSTVVMFEKHRFKAMAELVYLQRSIRRAKPPGALPGEFRLVNYSAEAHAGFATAVIASYEQSLDCPAMNGLRDIEDILAGHKSAGPFDPSDWFLLLHRDEPVGVLLLAMTHQMDGMELVYLGLAPKVRGYGLANYLLQVAESRVCERKVTKLSLAVDAGNAPALKLYYRHGMKQMTRKVALMRVLEGNAE